jgi:hypothetical protein
VSLPFHQRIIRSGIYVFAGVLLLGAFLDAISNAFALVSPRTTYRVSLIVLTCWVLLEFATKLIRPRWLIKNQQTVRVRRWNIQPRLMILGVVLLLWIPRTPQILQSAFASETPESPRVLIWLNNPSDTLIAVSLEGEYVLRPRDGRPPTQMYMQGHRGRLDVYSFGAGSRGDFLTIEPHHSILVSGVFGAPGNPCLFLGRRGADMKFFVRRTDGYVRGSDESVFFSCSKGVVVETSLSVSSAQ